LGPSAASCALIPPPPSSPAFPYATLFRSPGLLRAGVYGDRGWCTCALFRHDIRHALEDMGPRQCACCEEYRAFLRIQNYGYECEDRKSTRLNSSHVKISYAVFCLKKKTKS